MRFVVYLGMGHRQLALIFGIGTAALALLIATGRMSLGMSELGAGTVATAILYVIASIVQILVAKRKWELDYKNAFIMLLSTTVLCSFLYAFGYSYVANAFPDAWDKGDGHYQFGSLLIANIAFRVPVDAVAAIFYKR